MDRSEGEEDFWLFGYGYYTNQASYSTELLRADSSKLQKLDLEASASLW
jgi:hypothetical protein